ncbi:MAG: tetratricopeptide repeat protein [Patescibacteria group bacterium]|nr:tetratricopeptide repeat protein [Patescibacteria group bacterium]
MLNQDAVAKATWEGGEGVSPRLLKVLTWIIDACLYASVALVPLFFMPITLDVLELNKQTLLIILVMLGTTAWLGKAVAERRFMLSRAWIHLVVALFALGWLVTSLFSSDRYISLIGNIGQMQWSFATILAFVIFYFLVVNRVGTTRKLYNLILAFLASSFIVGLYGFLQMVGVYPLGWLAAATKTNTFNTVGTINAFGVYMVVPLIISISLTIFGCKDDECTLGQKSRGSVAANVIVWLTLLMSLVVAVVVDFWVIWAAIIFGTALLVILPIIRSLKIHHPSRIVVPAVVICISILLLIFRTPINLNLPSEVSPSMVASWDIAKSVLRQAPIFGSGPGTWIYDYAKFRSPEVNLSQFWTVRFERGLTTFFTLIAMIGLVGIALWLILIISAIANSAMHLIKERDDDAWQAYLTVFVGWATMAFIAFFYNYNFAHHFVFWFLLALLAALLSKKAFAWDAQKSAASSAVLSIGFIMLCVAALTTAWLAGQRLAADAAYSSAVLAYQAGKPIDQSIDSLNRAVIMNQMNDVYYRNLSQAYLIKAAQVFEAKKNEPDGAAAINQVIAATIDTAKKASDLNPQNVDNWENLAVIYQSISSFTQGADEFAIKNFQQALDREPNNPVYSTEIGKIYIARADSFATLLQSKDETARKDAEGKMTEALGSATEWLNRAIQAKADYAEAHYQLGMVYDRQGKTKDAITKLEQVVANSKDVGVAFQLAILYYRDNQKDKAMNMFEQIITLTPDYANARWFLSALYEEKGRLDDALAQVMKVQDTNKDNTDVAQRISYLQGLIAKQKSQPAAKTTGPQLTPVEEKIQGPQDQNPIQQKP